MSEQRLQPNKRTSIYLSKGIPLWLVRPRHVWAMWTNRAYFQKVAKAEVARLEAQSTELQRMMDGQLPSLYAVTRMNVFQAHDGPRIAASLRRVLRPRSARDYEEVQEFLEDAPNVWDRSKTLYVYLGNEAEEGREIRLNTLVPLPRNVPRAYLTLEDLTPGYFIISITLRVSDENCEFLRQAANRPRPYRIRWTSGSRLWFRVTARGAEGHTSSTVSDRIRELCAVALVPQDYGLLTMSAYPAGVSVVWGWPDSLEAVTGSRLVQRVLGCNTSLYYADDQKALFRAFPGEQNGDGSALTWIVQESALTENLLGPMASGETSIVPWLGLRRTAEAVRARQKRLQAELASGWLHTNRWVRWLRGRKLQRLLGELQEDGFLLGNLARLKGMRSLWRTYLTDGQVWAGLVERGSATRGAAAPFDVELLRAQACGDLDDRVAVAEEERMITERTVNQILQARLGVVMRAIAALSLFVAAAALVVAILSLVAGRK